MSSLGATLPEVTKRLLPAPGGGTAPTASSLPTSASASESFGSAVRGDGNFSENAAEYSHSSLHNHKYSPWKPLEKGYVKPAKDGKQETLIMAVQVHPQTVGGKRKSISFSPCPRKGHFGCGISLSVPKCQPRPPARGALLPHLGLGSLAGGKERRFPQVSPFPGHFYQMQLLSHLVPGKLCCCPLFSSTFTYLLTVAIFSLNPQFLCSARLEQREVRSQNGFLPRCWRVPRDSSWDAPQHPAGPSDPSWPC